MPKLIFIFSSLLLLLSLNACKKEVITTCAAASSPCDSIYNSLDSSKIGRKVLIIGMDGFRPDGMTEEITPFMYQLSQNSNTYYTNDNQVEDLTFSGPNWSSILNGVHYCKHNVTTNDFSKNNLQNYPHFFYYLEQANSNIRTASIVNWKPINTHLASLFGDYAPTTNFSDKDVLEAAKEALNNQDVIFLHFDEPDFAGHFNGFNPKKKKYCDALKNMDAYAKELFTLIEAKRALGEEWLVMIISDHGGKKHGHHGGQGNDLVEKTIFFANSPDVNFRQGASCSQVNLVPTVLEYLGIFSQQFSCRTDGVSMID